MKKLKFLSIIFLFIFSFLEVSNAQVYPYEFDCPDHTPHQGYNDTTDSPYAGLFKPTRSDEDGSGQQPDGFFPVLVIFVQFPNDPSIIGWPAGQAPEYLSNVIATSKEPVVNGEWWNAYSEQTQLLSDQYKEISRGHLDIISTVPNPQGYGAYSVVLPNTPAQYWDDSGGDLSFAERLINEDIWESVKLQGLTDWRRYDRWKKVGGQFYFTPLNFGDGYVDMIYKVHKTKGSLGGNNYILANITGYAYLGVRNQSFSYPVDAFGTLIQYGYGDLGSGVTLSYSGTFMNYVGGLGHEHMHYLLSSGHNTYSRLMLGVGFDAFISPFDMVVMGYAEDDIFEFTSEDYSLGDYSSRNDNDVGNILRVPIEGNQFFVLAYRNKESYWDRPMMGDTAQFDPYSITNDYGKGLYIYHTNTAYNVTNYRDMECADGYWSWVYGGKHYRVVAPTCFQSEPTWDYYLKDEPLYTNDPSKLGNTNFYGDGVSFHYHPNGQTLGALNKGWGFGKKEANSCELGTDRIWVNENEIHTFAENMGDRYDAWLPGYNEVFSSYSSPSTYKWNDDKSNIFIWFHAKNQGNAELKIYKVGENGTTLKMIYLK